MANSIKNTYYIVTKSLPAVKAMKDIKICYDEKGKFKYIVQSAYPNIKLFPNMVNQLGAILFRFEGIHRGSKQILSNRVLMAKGWYWANWMFYITKTPILLDTELEEFLRANSIYTRYMKNIKKQALYFPFYVATFSNGFDYTKTPEGKRYWYWFELKHIAQQINKKRHANN